MLRKTPLTSTHSYLIDITSLTCFLFLFYFLWLGSYPLFTPDEGRYVEAAREMLITGDYITPHINGMIFLDKPILYYWFQALSLNLFGNTEWAARLFPALFGLMGSLVTYFCGRRLFDRKTGILASLILSASPLYFVGAHYANLDLEIAVFVSCTLLFFITGAESKDNSRIYYFCSYIFAALAFLTKGMIGIVFPVMIIGAWIVLAYRWEVLKQCYLFSGLLLMIILILPWFFLAQQANPQFLYYFFVTQQISRFLSAGVFNNSTPSWFYIPIVLFGFLPWSAFICQTLFSHSKNYWRNSRQHQTTLFLLLWIALIFIFFSIPRSKIITYILPVFPALALLVGNYLASCWDKPKQSGIILARYLFLIIATALAITLLAFAQFNWFNFASSFLPYLITISFVIFCTIAILFCLRKNTTLLTLFITYLMCTALSLLLLVHGAKYLNQPSAKTLAINLKSIMQPGDEIVNYFKFYYDVPFYLETRVTIAADWQSSSILRRDNWLRELSFGRTFQHAEGWLIDESTFWQRFNSRKRLFVFINANYFDQFKARVKKYYLIGTSYDISLISNKPPFLPSTMSS